MFYSTSIFLSAGLTEMAAQQATLGMGVVNVGMTFISLVLVERAGRKTLMVIGLSIMLISTIMILICLVAAVSRATTFAYLLLNVKTVLFDWFTRVLMFFLTDPTFQFRTIRTINPKSATTFCATLSTQTQTENAKFHI